MLTCLGKEDTRRVTPFRMPDGHTTCAHLAPASQPSRCAPKPPGIMLMTPSTTKAPPHSLEKSSLRRIYLSYESKPRLEKPSEHQTETTAAPQNQGYKNRQRQDLRVRKRTEPSSPLLQQPNCLPCRRTKFNEAPKSSSTLGEICTLLQA